jgi:hypothetical protein
MQMESGIPPIEMSARTYYTIEIMQNGEKDNK